MTERKPTDLERTQELYDFLQGTVPKEYRIPESEMPKLTADQAWTVVWYLGNLYWQVKDYIERCDVCGDLYNSESEGTCLDYGDAPYYFCDDCEWGEEAEQKRASAASGLSDEEGTTDDH